MTAFGIKEYFKKLALICIILIIEAVILYVLQIIVSDISHKHSESINNNIKIQSKIYEDMKYFPIPIEFQGEVTYEDSFGAYRDNGGHEGCDIMDVQNEPGRIPVISTTDGIVTNLGWLYLGGYRIGITSDNGIYYYYAHLDSYAAGIDAGDEIKAGQLIGFMGDTGEGQEGTSGRFPVHLHLGIYVGMADGNEQAVNPYSYLNNIVTIRSKPQ
ncbi:MAG: M23 family metallopeptidase [Lachnospiraceae bacterium]|nr:M23 family metallopeptidase [Lachnospiraceae bacterium]